MIGTNFCYSGLRFWTDFSVHVCGGVWYHGKDWILCIIKELIHIEPNDRYGNSNNKTKKWKQALQRSVVLIKAINESYQQCILYYHAAYYLLCALQHISVTSVQLQVNHLSSHCVHCLMISIRIFTRETLSSISVLKYYDFMTTKQLKFQFSALSRHSRESWRTSCLSLCIYSLGSEYFLSSSSAAPTNSSSFFSKYFFSDFRSFCIFLRWETHI